MCTQLFAQKMCASPALFISLGLSEFVVKVSHFKITLIYRELFLTLKRSTLPQSWVIKADKNTVKSNGFNLAMGLINALDTLGSLPAVKLFRERHRENIGCRFTKDSSYYFAVYMTHFCRTHSHSDWSNTNM